MPSDAGFSLPAVSVIIPSYNCASVLGNALDSIRAQGRQTEVVIVDDGSTDDTAVVVERFRAASGLPVVYLPQTNQGPSAARNAGARQASGRYCIFLDADDRFLPEAFDRFEAAFRRHGEIDMIFGGFVDCRPDGTARTLPARPLTGDAAIDFREFLRRRPRPLAPGTALVHGRVLRRLQFPESVRLAEDVVFYGQVLATGRCASFPEPVVAYASDHDKSINRAMRRSADMLAVIDLLFDPDVLPPACLAFRGEYEGMQMLSLFRACYLAGRHAEARVYFHRALKLTPRRALSWRYARKYLRGLTGVGPGTRAQA
jgi:glycosyltransferase involved in cell wall biosynthesis